MGSQRAKRIDTDAAIGDRPIDARRVDRYPLAVGQITGGVEILEVFGDAPGEPAELRSYRVRYLCCGRVGDLRRPSMIARVRTDNNSCSVCRSRSAAKIAHQSHREIAAARRAARAERESVVGVVDATGYLGPTLGPMGPRWGAV